MSTPFSQQKLPCNNWGRPNFVGTSAVSKQQQFCKFPWQFQQNFQIAKVTYDIDAHLRRKIWKVRAVWRPVPNKSQNPYSGWQRRTESTTSILSWREMHYRHLKTIMALPERIWEIMAVFRFRRQYVKPQSMATAKHNFPKLVFKPANQKFVDFLDELQKLAKDAFGIATHAINEQFIYAKMPPHLRKSINQAIWKMAHMSRLLHTWKRN